MYPNILYLTREYGKDWYEAGIHDKKQNCFNDFIAAAEALCKLGYTSPNRYL